MKLTLRYVMFGVRELDEVSSKGAMTHIYRMRSSLSDGRPTERNGKLRLSQGMLFTIHFTTVIFDNIYRFNVTDKLLR